MYGPRISLIMLSSPITSVATSSFVSPVFVPALMFLSVEVGGIALCFEKASMSDFEIDDVFGMGDRDLDLT